MSTESLQSTWMPHEPILIRKRVITRLLEILYDMIEQQMEEDKESEEESKLEESLEDDITTKKKELCYNYQLT